MENRKILDTLAIICLLIIDILEESGYFEPPEPDWNEFPDPCDPFDDVMGQEV